MPDGLPVARIALTADHLARCDSRTQPAFVAGDVANTLWDRAKDAPAPTPPLLDGLTPWEQRASRALDDCLYLLLIGFPVSGYLISQGSSIDFFGWAIAPAAPSRVALAIHAWALASVVLRGACSAYRRGAETPFWGPRRIRRAPHVAMMQAAQFSRSFSAVSRRKMVQSPY